MLLPPERLADGALDLQALFTKHGDPESLWTRFSRHLHFLITPFLNDSRNSLNMARSCMMLVDLVVGKYDGSLKAEHGTGLTSPLTFSG